LATALPSAAFATYGALTAATTFAYSTRTRPATVTTTVCTVASAIIATQSFPFTFAAILASSLDG